MSKYAGSAVENAKADDLKLIRLVRARPPLYERSTLPVASYYNQVKRLWREVADVMGWSVPEVRRKWSHIRNSYSRHLRNQGLGARTGRGRAVSRWYLADELDFLAAHMATDTRQNRNVQSSQQSRRRRQALSLPSMIEIVRAESLAEVENPTPWLLAPALDVKSELDDSCDSQNFSRDENCSFFQFFRGIYNDYQELPVRKQRTFKRKCLLLLHDLLDEEESAEVEYEYQSDAMNLSNSLESEEHGPIVQETVTIANDGDLI